MILGGAGTQTAALAFGGEVTPSMLQEQQKNMMELTWTSPGSLNTARYGLGGAGVHKQQL
jgi:hypothetical protein